MKRIKILFAACLATALFSCNKQEVKEPVEGERATLSMSIVGSHGLKATGSITGENNVTNAAIFVFRAPDGTLDNSMVLDHLPNASDVINITSGSRNIYVILNFPTGSLDDIASNAELTQKTFALSTQNQGFLTMSAGVNMTILPGANYLTGPNAINVQRNVARINVGNINLTGPLAPYIQVTGVYMLNVKNTSSYVCATSSTPTSYALLTSGWSHGQGLTAGPIGFPAGSSATVSLTELPSPAPAAGANVPAWGAYFYVFEHLTPGVLGATSSDAVKLVIAAKFTDPDTSVTEDIYYPVLINRYDPISTTGVDQNSQFVKRNTQYTISATIQNAGVTDPEMELASSTISIEVQITPWSIVLQNVDF